MTRSQGRQLALIALVQVLAMALWFSASAVLPALRQEWDLGTSAANLLATSLQVGFVAGALLSAFLNIADRVRAHLLMSVSALTGSLLTALVLVIGEEYVLAVLIRFLTGVCLAGVYPVGMKLMATWFDRGRSFAMGVLIGALTLGSSLPQLLVAVSASDWRPVLVAAALLAGLGGIVALVLVRPGPHLAGAAPFAPRYAIRMFQDPNQRRINLGYYGHMWELYAFWTWLPTYLAAVEIFGDGIAIQSPAVGLLTFTVIGVAGTAGCVAAGRWGEGAGPVRMARLALVTSGTCAVASYGVSMLGLVPLTALLMIWGASVVADSGQFSAALSHVTDPGHVGTALTVQTAVGFAVTTVSIQGLPYLAEATSWRIAFVALSAGPLFGVLALRERRLVPAPS
ncbi:MFS transporter [Georgenia ruanii]|uniref:MFS transporter n=1 Tax=Georgenia ruanii TaxID=348442 RepID=A0A7J9UUV0_9MICO|nr:MFS transporter [Georgenia ruanii]MPV87630.1 MFS transporter [Georgenia ruanii]